MKPFIIFICFMIVGHSDFSFATINSDFSKPMEIHTPRNQQANSNKKSNSKSKKKKLRKIYVNFTDKKSSTVLNDKSSEDQNDFTSEENSSQNVRSNIRIKKLRNDSKSVSNTQSTLNNGNITNIPIFNEKGIGFTNQILFGYSNSAFRYSGEEFPTKSIDFIWVPLLASTCFSITCIYNARITGGFDLNNGAKNELGLIQLGLRFPQEPWGGYIMPDYGLRFFLPATPKEINDDKMVFGYGGAFSVSTTPDLLGTDFLMFTIALSARKDNYATELIAQRNWTAREALLIDFKFTENLFATTLFGHIFNQYYDKTNKDNLELIQAVRWRVASWLDLSVTHSNTKPTYLGDNSYQIDDRFISKDTSIVSFAIGITNRF